uniref:Dystonin n=1 Tax=Sinocyclocheilus rhinocerous TaxID=307959 RepID=A0A673GGE4_9TELE
MIAAAFLVLLRPLSIQYVLLLLLLLVGTVATILFLSSWHRKLRNEKIPIKSPETDASHHVCRHSPRHARRSARARVSEEKPLIESEPDSSAALRKRRVKKRVQPEFYHSVQLTPTRKPSSGSGNASLRCSMSSSADFSDDEEYSVKSGSVSPAPGDTLPWNLPRHERSKRKIQGGSVLDPAERAVLRIADERDRVQKKTFTKWINQHLLKVRKHVNDLYEDLRDGHNLISLLEVLSGETLPREKGRMRFHRLQNVQIALDFLKRRQVKLVNIRNDDITDGNPKLTLGLIWTIILHFQISDIHVTGESEDMTAKERLLLWSKQMTEGYVGVRCDNFTTSWRDGRLFNAIIHKYRPDLVDMSKVSTQSSRSNLEQAFGVAEQLGVARLLDPEDVDLSSPDEKSVITYVSTLYDIFPKVPEGMEGISANDVDIKWVEFQNMVKYLSQWIKHNVTVMSDRNFPSNPVELKALYTQYLQFKENEIPPKENEKAKIKHLYKMLEVWIEFGRIQLPQGYHPNDVEKEWGKLIVAMLEREKSLRPEVDRLEMLQQIANRVQRDCVAGEDKLALARTALQSDAKRLESGIQFQNEAETAGYLLECENLLRQQVLDIQLLLDGKFYLADQLVQRVSKLRDDLLALRTECSTVYSKGRTLTSEQTKMMISGITQSLNSNFSPNFSAGLSPALTHGGLVTSGGSPAMSPAMTPSMQPAAVQTYLSGRGGGGGGGMEPGVLQQLKHMQIRKPMLKSSFLDPNLTEDEVNVKFVQDLLSWVEEMQVQLDQAEWGSDLPSVESNLGNHKDFHKAIEEFQMSIKEAKMSEIQMTQPLKQSYSEKLNKLESQYRRLLRQKHLDSLYDFVSRATQELIWLNEKEEEEVAFDWSERNSNISRKRDYHADLMRELDDKEEVIKSVQEKAESLLQENHPARLTIEAYRAAMQTQWSWILQLCHCVEQHLKENAVYFDFFSDAKESLDYLKSLQDAIHRKYSCDRSSSLHRLEDLIQESMDEKEQLLKYSSTVGGLVGRAKSVVQLKARNPENPIRTSIPVKSICDYRQIEITISKEDECVLVSNSHRAKWKVISPSGNEAMVPSVCFSVPPPNREATEMASRIEQLYQNALALWHHSHINMKSVVSWHYLMTDIHAIRKSTVASIKTLLPGDHEQVLSSLQSHFEDFLRDSDESEVFTVADCAQLEKEVLACKEYYEELLKSAEREEHEESVYNLFISEVRNFRMRVEGHEEQLIRKIRTPLDRDDLQECVLRITEQEKKKVELDRLKDDLECLREKCDVFLRQAAASPSVPTLSSELNILTQSTNQVYSMCCIYLEKLKTVSLVVKHSQSAEALVKLYEAKLCEEDTINANIKSIDGVMSTLKQWRSEIDERREVFHDLEDELQKARVVSERMFKTHNERDFDLDWHKEKADQLKERWQNIHSQIENRLRDLEGISKSLKYYKDTYNSLDEWSEEMEAKQLKAQENQPEDSKALAEFLNQQKVLVTEIEQKQSKIEECQKYSEQYAVGVKDYELQLMTYRAMVDSQHKSPVKRRKMQSSSDVIQQEFMDLRTRYTALVTLMTQYVKFAGETLKRAEEDEVGHLLTYSLTLHPVVLISIRIMSLEEMVTKKEQIGEALRTTQLMLTKHSDKYVMSMEGKEFTENELNILISVISFQALQVIQGILDVESGAVMSVCYSVNNGFINQNTGLGLLEAQLITTGLIWPEQHLYMDLEDAFKNRLVDDAMCKQLQELNEAKKCLQNLQFALEPLPVITALENGAISEQTAIKIIEIQLATGGLRPTYTGDILHLERAFQLGLIPESLFIQILERKDSWKNLIDPNTAEKVTLSQLVQRSMMHERTGLRLLPVKRRKDGTISLTSGREINIMKAMHEGIIDRETMFRLLSTQLFAGGIADAKTGRKLTVEEALSEGLIDQDTASEILSHQAQNGGIVNPCNGARLTVDEAVQCDLISSSSALLVLERQKAFMGLLWPNAGEILSFSTSLQQNIITDKLASELLHNRHKITALYIPETSEVADIDSAGENNLIETFTKELLKTIEIPDVVPDIDELNNRFSSWLVMRELQIDGSCSSGEEISDENSSDGPSPSEAKQLFISYLMMNSYMDPKSGQRLLIFDWQLNKMAKLLFETSESEDVDEISGLYMNVSEEPPLNNSIPDNANASLNVDYSALGELQICESLESTTEEDLPVLSVCMVICAVVYCLFLYSVALLHNSFLLFPNYSHPLCFQSLEAQIAALPDLLTADLTVAEQLLNSADELIPMQIHQDLAAVYVDLQNAFTDVCHLSAERSNAILLAVETVKVSKDDIEKDLSGTRQLLEDAAFDIQNFISEHAQFLSPTHSRYLLRALSATQRSYKELMDRVFTQRQTLEVQLEIREEENQHKAAVEKQREFSEKLQELFDDLTQTENRLIGHQQQAASAKTVGDLQQYQQEHQALQKDLQANASALNEVISSTNKFLEENRSKLTPEQISALENKLEELKSKVNMLNQRAEESRKDLEKVLTSAIKQETETVAAVEQLEESKTKIEGLLDWISNVGKEKEMGGIQKDQMVKQNGNMPENTSVKRIIGEEDDPNGNALDTTDNTSLIGLFQSLQGQTTSRQAAVDSLRKTADALISAEGDLLSHPEEIQETVDDIIERYDNLSKSVSDRNEKLQVTLTRSLSVQDGLDEMMSWMEKVEESVKETAKVPLDSSSIADALSKEAALEQDMSSRQSSILAMKAKVKKFVESAEPAAAVLLQAKMEGLSQRFTDASERHKQKVAQMEELRDKVEQFEKTFEKVQQFVLKSSQALSETDGPGKNVAELSQLIQDTNAELAEHAKDMETLQKLTEELGKLGPEGSTALLQSKMQNISDNFNAFKETITEKKEEVSSCQKQLQEFKAAAGVLMKWLEETKEQVPVLQPNCSEQGLGTDLQKGLLGDWTSKAPAVQDINSKGSALCSLISVLTSPAKAKIRHNSGIAQEYFKISHHILYLPLELMLVQQNMSYINNNYEHLGELLKARSSELGALLKRVLGVHDQAESLRQWMEDTKKTATSLSNHPSGKDTVKSQIEQQKVFDDNMKQKQVQLQQLRENLLRLIEEHPDSPEAEQWKHMLAQIDAGWEEVRGTMEIRKQHLEESSRMLELFQTTQPQLSQWLQEKELMMGVLGPLSVDPNMLNTQKQQVQILLKEFDSRKPQYEKLTEAATAIASASEQQDPAVEQVKEQLASVSQKWQALTGQLSQRHALIEQAVGKTTQFQELLQSLSKSATCLETELNNQQALSTQPDEVKKQIEATNTILAQLREEKKRLKEAETVCSELSAMVTEEYLRADLTKQLEGITKPFRQLEDKAGIVQLNSAFASSQQFHQTSKDFQAWLNQTLQEQCKPQPISANAEKLKQSLKENSAAQKAISEHEEPYNTIIKEGEALLQSTEGAEKVALQGQLSALKSSWDDVKKGNAEQAEKLQGALERALKYKEHYEKLSSWLQEVEDREKYVKLSANSVEIEGSLSQLKAIQKDVEKHRGQVVMMNAAADSLLEVVTSDGDSVREEKAAIGKKVDKLTEDLTLKRESLENISQKLKEFNDLQKEAKGQLEAARKQLDSHSALGVQAYSNKNLTNMNAQQNSLEGVHNQIEHLKNVAKSLVVDASEVEGVTDLLLQADSLEKDHMSITKKVEDACSTLEDKLQGIGQFQNSIREMFANFTDLDDEFDGMAPVGRDLDTLGDQQSTIKHFIARLQDLMTNTANGRDSCKKMLESEASPDHLGLKRDLETLGKQCGKLMDRATGRREQVEETLSHLEEFYVKAQEFTHKLSSAEKQEESQGSVGLETEVINQQLESFKVFQKDIIESLQSQLQELNTLGQALIQNAAKGTSTKKLDHDLVEVNTRWNIVLVFSFDPFFFCYGFRTLEEVLGHGKILYQAMSLGQSLRAVSCADDKELVQAKLDITHSSYIELQEHCRQKAELLRQALANAQLFGEDEVALMTWLDEVHGKLSEVSIQDYTTTVLSKQHAEQLALHEDIELRKQNIEQAVLNGLELLKQTTGDEVVVIQGKLDGIKTRYSEINTMSNNVSKTLDKALSLATKLQNTHEELNSWLEKVESELATFTAQEPVGEQLTHLQERQKTLMKEVKDQKPLVDSLNEVSSALLELVPWRAREGLDRMVTDDNERYRTASDAITQHVDQTGAAILKSQQFEQAATTELEWLTEAERKLSCLGDVRLEPEQTTAQLQAQKSFSMDIMRHKDAVDAIVKTSEVIMNSKDEAEKQMKLQTLSEKYNVVSQLNSERCLQLERAHSLASQFWETYDELWPWLQETRTTFTQLSQPAIEYEALRQQQEELRQMRELIAEHKPHIDKMNKTGPQLVELSPTEGLPIREKYETSEKLYSQLKVNVKHRAAALDEAISKSTQFHDKIDPMLESLERIAERLRQPPSISVEVEKIREQISENKAVNVDLEKLQPSYETLMQRGEEMIARSEGADKDLSAKAVQDKLDQMVFLWNDIQALLEEREAKLLDVMDLAEKFWCDHCDCFVSIIELTDHTANHSDVNKHCSAHEARGLQNNMFDSVDIMEGKLDSMSPVGTDLETVKQQIEELKEFKGDAYQLQIEMERLNHQTGLLLKKVVEEADRTSILEPMNELKMLWENLDKKIINRQHKLEGALLALGQFQHALDELLAWLTHTEELLNEQRKACGDPKAIEIELAKHHVLQNDVLAHKTTVEAVNKAGSDLIDSSAGEEARGLQNKLENLNQRWRTILEKTEQRRQLLDSALLQAQGFHGEIEDMQRWLKDTERQLLASKALGGLPETAREQLNTHLELCSTLEAKEEIYKQLLDRGQQILALTPEGQDSTTELDLRNLQEKWECVQTKVTERKVKLEEALAMATDFHNSLQDFINWLTQAEQTLTMVSPASLILETVMFQIDEHKVFVTEVNSHRDQIIELDKTGTHLKYFSQKQDVVLIKNLLLSVQGRWEKVVQRSVERGRLLDDARKRAKQFHETWNKLMEWLEESERALDSELEIANDPDKIKMQLSQHKEFQKTLGSKHSVCDTTSRTGRALKDKTSLQDDNQKLDDMLSELRDKWDTVCGKSVERQNKLEEALLFSGQFTDALQALIDWLYKVEPQLAEDQPVHGDIDLVLNLIDSHKVFQKELGKRTGSVQALKRSARELIESSHDDSSWVKAQMQELSTRWETVCSLSVSKQTRLEQALCQAEEFHSTVHILLEWLAEAEQSLRFHGALPDDEEALRALIEQHKEFMKKLEEKRLALNKATSMGEAILSICHPDSITTIKHWNTIIKARFEEVTAWARQHQQRLSSALAELLATQELLENLLNWLKWAETTLGEKDKEPLPQELEEVKSLIAEHQTFMEEMTRNQPDVDKITKTHKRKATADPPVQSQIPILGKGRTRSPTQSMYTAASQAQIETKNPRVNLLVSKWQQVWLLALDRRRKLNDALDRLEELKEFANFDFDVWRKRYMRWMNHKKSRVMDFFRRIDKDQDGKVTRQEFIDGILSSKFPTSRLEMSAVADIFDRDGDGYIDYYEFVAALHPNKDAYKPLTDADKIEDEVTRQVAKCKCPKRFQVEQIGANKYRVSDRFFMFCCGLASRLIALYDLPPAKGRTNLELREKFILPEGTTQVMASFRYRGRRSRPSSRGASPNRSNSSYSCPAQPNPPGSNTPKTPQHLTRNYDKPWLTNSKSATPLKSSDSFDSQGSSNESTPIQGSKLRLPGYLSGKGFQSGEDGTLINVAVMKARGQAMGDKIPSRPGSKAGSRGSSRRGSDASDFDISDIQSVCSDVSETVTDSGRPTPRSASRQHGGKLSKIPTPQRRSTPTSKLAKNTKR